VRPAGSANNGGGYNPSRALAGTDYSQQAAAQLAATDLACANSTTLTSAAAGFTALMVGNLIHITAGTNFTTGFYEIVAFTSATTVTLDRNPTTGASATAGTGRVGGALASTATIAAVVVPGNVIHLVGTTFTTAAALAFSVDATDGLPITWIGHAAARTDDGNALITSTNAAAAQVIEVTGAANILKGITADGGSVSVRGIRVNDFGVLLDGCKALNCTQHGIYVTSSGLRAIVRRCLATANGSTSTSAGFACEGAVATFDRCVSRSNSGNGFYGILGTPRWLNCLAHGNTLAGFYVTGNNSGVEMYANTAYGNTQDGLRIENTAALMGGLVRGNLFAGNGGYGINSITTDYSLHAQLAAYLETNAFWNNTSGARHNMPTGDTDITLTADPFTDAAGSDFSLNLTEGGGLALRAAGEPGEFGLRSAPETSIGYSDVGAVPASGNTAGTTSVGAMRTLWRELTGEKYTGVVPNAIVDLYLNRGLEWLNQVTEYHWDTNDGGITLVASTQEYDLDETVVRIEQVRHNGLMLTRGDIRQWDSEESDTWRTEAAATPTQWAVYGGNRLVLRPKPSAAAVLAASVLSIWHVSVPPDIGTAGAEQLQQQDRRLAVFYAAHLWSIAYPDSALAMQRSEGLLSRSREEARFTARDAAAKETARS
jgi:hypothetical protein